MSPHCSSADVEPQGKWKGLPAVFLCVATNVAATPTAAKIEDWERVKHEFISTHTHFPDVCSCWSHWGKRHLPHTYTHTDIMCSYAANTVLCLPPGSACRTCHDCREPPAPRSQTLPRRAHTQRPLDMTSLSSHLNAEEPCQRQNSLWVSPGFPWDSSPHHLSFNRSLPKDWSLTNVLYGNLHLSVPSREHNHILHKKPEGEIVPYYSICRFTKVK